MALYTFKVIIKNIKSLIKLNAYIQTITINIFTDSDLHVKIFRGKHLILKNLPNKVSKVKLNVTKQDCY